MRNKITRGYEVNYRGGRIVCTTEKSLDAESWTACGWAEIAQDSTYARKPINLVDSIFTNEEDAKKELIQLAKNWIEAMT
jgi:hypothetical protein